MPHSRQEKVAEFQEFLHHAHVESVQVNIDPDAEIPAAEAQSRFTRLHYPTLPTLFVVPEMYEFAEEGILGFEPFTSRSGNASRHGVFFGAIICNDGSQIAAAVKPHDLSAGTGPRYLDEESCLKEFFANAAAQKLGFEGLQPLGFAHNREGTFYSLTLLNESLDTLDTLDWTSFCAENFTNIGMKEIMHKTALQAAFLHQNGKSNKGDSFHGDMAARNVAIDLDGHVFFIDWEDGVVTNASTCDIEERFGRSLTDIKAFMVSLARPAGLKYNPGLGIFEHSSDWWVDFKDIFLDDYIETRLAIAATGTHHMRTLNQTREELVQLQHTLSLHMQQLEQQFLKFSSET